MPRVAIDPTTPATLYFGSEDGGVFKSTNAGETWSAGTGLPESTSVNALVIDFSTPRTLYAGTAGGIFKSTDGGGTWSAINTGLPDNGDARDVFALAIDPKTPTTLYAGTVTGVFKSTDGGGNWQAVNAGLPDEPFVDALAVDPTHARHALRRGGWGG